jgi:hypothetical protein
MIVCRRESCGMISCAAAAVRKLLCEAAWQGIRRSLALRSFFERITRGEADRRKIALVATAHHLARVMAAMLRTGEVWREREQARPDSTRNKEGRAAPGGCLASPPPEDHGGVSCHVLLMAGLSAVVVAVAVVIEYVVATGETG